jgi:hypothetical protein
LVIFPVEIEAQDQYYLHCGFYKSDRVCSNYADRVLRPIDLTKKDGSAIITTL